MAFIEKLVTDGGTYSEIHYQAPAITLSLPSSGFSVLSNRASGRIHQTITGYHAYNNTAVENIAIFKILNDGVDTGYTVNIQAFGDGSAPFARLKVYHNGSDVTFSGPTGTSANTSFGYYSLYFDGDNKLYFYFVETDNNSGDNPRIDNNNYAFGNFFDLNNFTAYIKSYYGFQGTVTIFSKEISSPEFGTPSTTGGYTGGTFDDSSDTISLPNTPSMGVTSAGFVNVYNPTAGELANLGSELFPDLSFTSETPVSGSAGVTEAIEAAANALVNFGNQIPKIVDMYINSNLIQYVIDCHILPVAPTTSGTSNVKVGFKTFTPAPKLVTSDYVDFDCGSLNIGEYYANFIDYAPYTKCKLFLPFVGFVDLQPEYWQSGTIKVVYRFNIIDGSFMAFVISSSSKSKLSNTVIAQYGGNACVHIPITGLNYSSMVSGVVSGAQAVISAQSGVQAATRAVNSAVDVMNAKPPVQQSNSYNATTSFLGVRTPYLLIERSVSNFSANYTDEKGVPSNISTSFSGLSGYTEAASVHLDGITGATSEELTEISELLARGVIL